MASGKHKDLYVKVFMDFWISSTWPPPPVPLACETNTEIQTPHNNIKHCCKTLVKCYSIWTVSSNLSLYHYVFAHIQTVSLWISGGDFLSDLLLHIKSVHQYVYTSYEWIIQKQNKWLFL